MSPSYQALYKLACLPKKKKQFNTALIIRSFICFILCHESTKLESQHSPHFIKQNFNNESSNMWKILILFVVVCTTTITHIKFIRN